MRTLFIAWIAGFMLYNFFGVDTLGSVALGFAISGFYWILRDKADKAARS